MTLNKSANTNLLIKNMDSVNEEEYAKNIYSNNKYDHKELKEIIKKTPKRLFGFYWFNPKLANDEDWKKLVDSIKRDNFKGVKTQATLDNLKMPDEFHNLAEFCIDFGVPLYLHSGSSFFYQEPFRAKDIYTLVSQYKELKCVIGHAAFTMEYCISLLRYFPKCSNVFFETSLSVPYGINVLIKVMGQNRVMYGSDSPAATTPDIEINKIKILNLRKDILEDVFYNNISNLIGESL
jgi:predicted TIM-barrel fold metal-dependent hydrolase